MASQTMQDIGKWLMEQGNKVVDAAMEPLRKIVADFSAQADAVEGQIVRYARAKEAYQKAGVSWPVQFTNNVNALNVQAKDNRAWKVKLLKTMAAAKANPKDYGLTVVGLTKADIDGAYPGLMYDPKAIRLGVAPVIVPLVIEASIYVSLAAAIAYMAKLLVDVQKVDFVADMTREFIAKGASPAEAAARARELLEGVRQATESRPGGFLDDLATLAKWGTGLVVVGVGGWKLIHAGSKK